MKIMQKLIYIPICAILMSGCVTGCITAGKRLDPDFRWRMAEGRRDSVMQSVEKICQLQSDYKAVTLLAHDGDLRARAFLRLAELDLALRDYNAARHNLEQSLRAGPAPRNQRIALLMLGDILERYLDQKAEAKTAYLQVINEHPGTAEGELAQLRLKTLRHE